MIRYKNITSDSSIEYLIVPAVFILNFPCYHEYVCLHILNWLCSRKSCTMKCYSDDTGRYNFFLAFRDSISFIHANQPANLMFWHFVTLFSLLWWRLIVTLVLVWKNCNDYLFTYLLSQYALQSIIACLIMSKQLQ